MSADGHMRYGANMIKSFDLNWPEEIGLYVYCEKFYKKNEHGERIKILSLEFDGAFADFMRKYSLNKEANGFRNTGNGKSFYDFKMDAVRFARKSYVITREGMIADNLILIWLDADVMTNAKITYEFIYKIIPHDDEFGCCLMRPGLYTETGFLSFSTGHPLAQKFFEAWIGLYTHEQILGMTHRTDCHAFDYVRKMNPEIKFRDLTPAGMNICDHVFNKSILGQCMDHLKGERRKKAGRS